MCANQACLHCCGCMSLLRPCCPSAQGASTPCKRRLQALTRRGRGSCRRCAWCGAKVPTRGTRQCLECRPAHAAANMQCPNLWRLLRQCPPARRTWCLKYSSFTEKLPTRAFLVALEEDEEIEAQLSQGVNVRSPWGNEMPYSKSIRHVLVPGRARGRRGDQPAAVTRRQPVSTLITPRRY